MNLIICYTPLQVLIAKKIMALYPNETFFGVMLCSVQSKKFDYYGKELEKCCEQFFTMHQHTDRFNLLKEIAYLRLKFLGKKFDKVFVASINDMQIQFILSSSKFNEFYTFDDGTANIVDNSVYYTDEPNTAIRKLINTLFMNKYSVRKLKALSKAHYTIYPNFANIIENTIPINLIESNSTQQLESDDATNILLGQPIYLEQEKNIALAKDVIKRFNIQLYLPHPREQYKLDGVTYVDTPLIFEDYIAQSFANKKCRVYTYFSSAILNVLNNPNIEVVALRIDTDKQAFINCYQLFDKLGVNVVDVRK
ncbi:CMP-N-acetylneuraminate-beta-galactosamide-alpha-2, 3-sialyltransferase [Pasteurellaceae bacterium 15-036681]|nr:CMP-N-acetylneuraminate-beta-galactosamide-alpha-2, 3-sialyltransferase [Pasteurellaceae bacterium 15-036681]